MANEATAPQTNEPEVIEAPTELTVVEAMNRAEIDMQISTAKRYPRSIKKFRAEAKDMACLDEEIASSCMYALPRGNKSIEGPSARLAEICLSAWGNCAGAARIIEEGQRFVTAQGVFKDYERNTAVTFEVRRRITTRNGTRFNDDMIGVTSNAACSIAFRNAVFKGIPKAFWQHVYDEARKTAIGDASTLANRRAQMFEYFQKMGVQAEQILAILEKKGIEDIGGEDLLRLKGLATAIKEGDTSVDQAFPTDLASAPTGRINVKPEPRPESDIHPAEHKQPVDPAWAGEQQPASVTANESAATQTQEPAEQDADASAQPSVATTPPSTSDVPKQSEARNDWLARFAMRNAERSDTEAAKSVMRRWLMANSIAPSQLDKDSVFIPARTAVEGIDWAPLFDEYEKAKADAQQAKA